MACMLICTASMSFASSAAIIDVYSSEIPEVEDLGDLADSVGKYQKMEIAHAMGKVDGISYTNSKEAMERSYALGFRIFECDFSVTSDGGLVALHSWDEWQDSMSGGMYTDTRPTTEQFLSVKLYGEYTPMSIDDILLYMKEHADMWLVTDFCETREGEYQYAYQIIVSAAERLDCKDVLSRFIIQIYKDYMYEGIKAVYPFEHWIYTLYLEDFNGEPDKFAQYASFCRDNNIGVITMWYYLYSDEIGQMASNYDISVYVHTVDDPEMKEEFIEKGVGVYTGEF